MSSTTPVIVHTSPPLSPLPASDVESVQLLAGLRAAGVDVAVTTADWADSGKPFASRTAHSSPLSGSALPSLPGYRNIDARLTPDQRADALTWTAYISGTLTDLIYHSLYSLPPNYAFLAGAQTAALPFPLAHYVPHRLRGIHAARLRSVGLWGLGGEVEETATSGESVLDDTVIAPGGTKAPRAWAGWRAGREAADRKRVFGQEKVRVRARTALEPIARQLGEGAYFFGNSPTSLDIALFANLALVLDPALPDPLLANFIRAELPSLSAHHDRVLASLWPRGWDSVRRVTVGTAPAPSLGERVRSFLPSWAGGPSSTASRKASEEPGEQTSKDAARRLARGRWMWFLAVPFTVVVYLLASGVVEIDFSGEECEEEEEEAFELVYDDEGFLTLPVEDDEDEDEDEDED